MMMDIGQAAKAMRDEETLAEIEDFIEGFNQPTFSGMRISGQRVDTWSSQHLFLKWKGVHKTGSTPTVALAFATERRFACGF